MKTITVQEASGLWRDALDGREARRVTLGLNQALGSVLAESIVASQSIPAFNKSAMDGYAIAYQEGIQEYEVMGLIGAGQVWDQPLATGQALRIMTGAPLPQACDTVIMQEAVDGSGQVGSRIAVRGVVKKGQHVIQKGEECAPGDILLEPGLLLDGTVQSVLAGIGRQEVAVYEPLKALLLTSGREIIEPGQVLEPGQIYNSNRFLLEGLLRETGISSIRHYHVSDDPELLEGEIQTVMELAQGVDIILSSGGVSVGLFDSMPHIYEALGARMLYQRIAMRPGAASYGGITPEGRLIFGLSGNPVAAYNGYHLLVKPALQLARGIGLEKESLMTAILDCDMAKKNPLDRYVQGQAYWYAGNLHFRMAPSQSSSAMVSLASVNALAYVPQGTEGLGKGSPIHIISTKSI